jgi:hypothetical protein
MMLLLLVRLLLLVLVLVVMMLLPPTPLSALEFALFSLDAIFDEQYESIPDDEIAMLARKF